MFRKRCLSSTLIESADLLKIDKTGPYSMTFHLEAFRASITRDFYSIEGFVNWPEIEQRLDTYANAFRVLNNLVSQGLSVEGLAESLLETPTTLDVIRTLLAIPQEAIGFSDGRGLPVRAPKTYDEAIEMSSVLSDLGLSNVLKPGIDVTTLFLTSEVARDAKSRRSRLGHRIASEVSSAIASAVSAAALQLGQKVEVMKPSRSERIAVARQVDYLVYVDSKPLVGIVIAFQAAYGGRQFRDLAFVYPGLQERLSEIPLDLFVIADGHGIAVAPEKVVNGLAENVAALMTIKQARNGMLAKEIIRTASAGARKVTSGDALQEIIEAGLSAGESISAQSLPASSEVAKLAIAQYSANHNEYALELSSDSTALAWIRSDYVKQAADIINQFNNEKSLRLIAALMRSEFTAVADIDDLKGQYGVFSLNEHPLLPQKLLVASTPNAVDRTILKQVARLALQKTPESKLALLIVPGATLPLDDEDFRRAQRELSVSVIVISARILRELAQRRQSPVEGLISQILAQSDLTKVSPFILNNATPSRMFYGREAEEATLLSTLGSNSVALLGGRRIGKTSLIRHVRSALESADFNPLFGDCQTVRNWDDFGGLIERSWKVKVERPFSPQHLFSVIDALAAKSNKKLVIFLDEIDQLLDWDQHHSSGEVSEALFKAFRSLSQEGVAQFVFSGERTIATKLWDPHSPHWNFCRPLLLRQLSFASSQSLLIDTFKAMQIVIPNENAFADLAWSATSGHPQILQYLGDAVVLLLNERPAIERSIVTAADLLTVASSFEFASHYLATYWGQATVLEKMISLIVVQNIDDPTKIHSHLEQMRVEHTQDQLQTGLRMLELYGILDVTSQGYALRATWFLEALKHYGGPAAVLETLMTRG